MKEYIVCAAVHFEDGKNYVHQPVNIKTGFVVCGLRHHNCFATFSIIARLTHWNYEAQGFLTNTNRFVSRQDAARIAYRAGQINDAHKKELFSEDIY